MLRKGLAAALALGAVTLTACSESLGPNVSATEEERTEVIQVAEESGFFADGFGVEGAFDESDGASAALMGAAAAGEVVVPRVWGRRKGLPIRRVITVEVDREAGIASITKELVFDGEFLLDLSDDDVINPASKPLEVTLLLHAEFMRLDEPNDRGRSWQLKGVSAAQWYMTDAAKQTVNLTKVEVYVDDVLVLLVTDPSELLQLENEIPLIDKDDLVVVRAWVDNTSDSASVNEPATFGLPIDIDIKPNSAPSCFNSDGNGVIPVAILGSATFDVSDIDIGTLVLDGQEVSVRGKDKIMCHLEDSNGDGFTDLVCQIEDEDGTYAQGDGTGTITGNLNDGTPIQGSDSICITQ